MAQWFSSFYFYLVDLWRRCFSNIYLVKAEGNSMEVHDFRRCQKCIEFIASLNVRYKEQRCEKCKAILHREGVYLDKNRTFRLHRSLHNKSFAIMQILLMSFTVVGMSIFKIKSVPNEYSNEPLIIVLLVCSMLSGIVLFLILTVNSKLFDALFKSKSFVAIFLRFWYFGVPPVIITAILILGTDSICGRSLIPFWVDVPSQQQVYEQQYDMLKQMSLSAERFSFALTIAKNPLVNLEEEYVQIVAEDFPGLMKNHSGDVRRLERGSQQQREFYKYYRRYLESLGGNALQEQCEYDPWNLATSESLRFYPETWEHCHK